MRLSRPEAKSFAKDLKTFARSKAFPIIQEIDDYLIGNPYLKTGFESIIAQHAGEPQKKLWRKLKAFNCLMLEHYWLKVEGSKLDYSGCEFKKDFSKGRAT